MEGWKVERYQEVMGEGGRGYKGWQSQNARSDILRVTVVSD